jgi:23S rRNA pseudouridine1911/1915/1917 synthase
VNLPARPVERRAGAVWIDIPMSRRGERLDQTLVAILPEVSRAEVQRLIRAGRVRVGGGSVTRPSCRVRGGERVCLDFPEPAPAGLPAEARPLDVLHEDPDLLVLDKATGIVVHPGAGARSGTLVNFLLHHCGHLSAIGGQERPGIVHRLDRDTTGVLVIAKNDATHRSLAAQFKDRTIEKIYEALVWGAPRPASGVIDAPIGRHPSARVKMVVRPDGRPSRSSFRTLESFGVVTLLEVRPETGRTHQIRVHLKSIGHTVVGDALYGGARAGSLRDEAWRAALSAYGGLALHARSLSFTHPATGRRLRFEAPRPADLRRLIDEARRLVPQDPRPGERR